MKSQFTSKYLCILHMPLHVAEKTSLCQHWLFHIGKKWCMCKINKRIDYCNGFGGSVHLLYGLISLLIVC